MIIGVPTEIKPQERRVALTVWGADELVRRGHEVLVERGAGTGARQSDEAYREAGACLVDVDEVFERAELVVKVKEPQAEEVARLRDGQALFTYLHLAAEPRLVRGLADRGVHAIAYETVTDAAGRLPLLRPMSEVAGRVAAQVCAQVLTAPSGGAGVLIGGAVGVAPARVVVIGGGAAGTAAATVAAGMGADVVVLERSETRLHELDERFGVRVRTRHSTRSALRELLPSADAVIGTVLVAGARAPRVLEHSDLALLRPGTVLVDVAIDQGGCFETSHPTTHAEPTYEVDGVVHYAVTNMPGSVPVTSTAALCGATLPYVLALAGRGVVGALERDTHLAAGENIRDGRVVHPVVAAALEQTAVAA